ncbi:MAG TPA: hypothetical protein VIX37_07660 [Candidatus Sulfotelmatobacter sp.]
MKITHIPIKNAQAAIRMVRARPKRIPSEKVLAHLAQIGFKPTPERNTTL